MENEKVRIIFGKRQQPISAVREKESEKLRLETYLSQNLRRRRADSVRPRQS